MAFKIADSAAKFKKSEGEQFTEAFGTLSSWITQLKKDVQSSRQELIKERLGWNRKNLQIHTSQLQILAMSRKDPYSADQNGIKNMLSFRIESALCKLSGSDPASGDRENVNSQEEVSSSIIFGNNNGGKCVIRLISLPYIEKIPPYTSWIFLDRNQRMAEDQSVVGRRRIYYDQYGSEALICSDSEEEVVEPEEEKQEFSEGEDQILRKVLQEHGLQQEVLNILSQFIEADSSGIKARYETLMEQYQEKHVKKNEVLGEMAPERNTFFNKSLSAALDSFDNLFCRRCLIFDCRLHGCSQGLIIPSEKLSFSGELEERGTPCSNQCYLGRDDVQDSSAERSGTSAPCASDVISAGNDGMSLVSNFEDSNSDGDGIGMAISDGSCMGANGPMSVSSRTADISKVVAAKIKALDADKPILAESFSENIRKRKMLKHGKIPPGNYNSSAEEFLDSDSKKQKKIGSSDPEAPNEQQIWMRTQDASAESTKNHPKKYDYVDSVAASDLKSENLPENESAKTDVLESPLEKQHSISCKGQVELAQRHLGWNLIEKELYLKGIEIFGKNSCLIARNLLPGLKTCIEVSNYMCGDGAAMHHRSSVLLNSSSEDNGKADPDYTVADQLWVLRTDNTPWDFHQVLRKIDDQATFVAIVHTVKYCKIVVMLRISIYISLVGASCSPFLLTQEQEMPTRTRFWRRRGRARKLKYTWKSAGHPSIRKRMADGKQQCKQYTPCGCQPTCGKQCPCLHNGTCCEKYCGCSKSCKNRFRGCHCAKSQCRSRQCPCFAAGRECDPDVCRNCWVSCGDGTSDKPPARGDDYQCGNMKLLLKQQQRILLGKSNVAGWGAFIKNPVNKNEYLGEYTGELISHREADKRGKIYDRANSSFLFDLNDQFVLDAYRKGDKLKFANHSSNPNCYAKVMMVAGDHRVGIFAKEHIDASEELFYDYRYEPDRAPIWARKPEGSSSKRDDSYVSHGRAQKKA